MVQTAQQVHDIPFHNSETTLRLVEPLASPFAEGGTTGIVLVSEYDGYRTYQTIYLTTDVRPTVLALI